VENWAIGTKVRAITDIASTALGEEIVVCQ
jgi:hypothetical protein